MKKRESFEERLTSYKNRMELVRASIGVVVLIIQFIILYHIIDK
jgi:hypothetical protein